MREASGARIRHVTSRDMTGMPVQPPNGFLRNLQQTPGPNPKIKMKISTGRNWQPESIIHVITLHPPKVEHCAETRDVMTWRVPRFQKLIRVHQFRHKPNQAERAKLI